MIPARSDGAQGVAYYARLMGLFTCVLMFAFAIIGLTDTMVAGWAVPDLLLAIPLALLEWPVDSFACYFNLFNTVFWARGLLWVALSIPGFLNPYTITPGVFMILTGIMYIVASAKGESGERILKPVAATPAP